MAEILWQFSRSHTKIHVPVPLTTLLTSQHCDAAACRPRLALKIEHTAVKTLPYPYFINTFSLSLMDSRILPSAYTQNKCVTLFQAAASMTAVDSVESTITTCNRREAQSCMTCLDHRKICASYQQVAIHPMITMRTFQ